MEQEEQQEVEETSLSDDLAAAWDEFEGAEESEDVEVQSEEPIQGAANESPEPVEETGDDVLAEGVQGDEKEGDGEAGDKPPVGLSATAREAWKETPAAIKAELAKREKDFATGIQKYAEGANKAQAMDRALDPYKQLFAMNGGAHKTLPGLLQTASALQMGSPVQRAQTVANLISQFGVDIHTLDGLLSGNGVPQEKQQVDAVQQQIQQAIAPFQQREQQMQQMQQHRQQQAQQAIGSELQQFGASNEFYMDVRGDMADILEMASNRGRQMTLDEAYNKACQLHPEVSKIMTQRSNVPTSGKRRAASSIRGTPGGNGASNEPDSMREAIERAWDSAGQI